MTATTNRLLAATFSTIFFHWIFLSHHFQQNRTLPTPLPPQRIVVSFGKQKTPPEQKSIKKQPVLPKTTQTPAVVKPPARKEPQAQISPIKINPLKKKRLPVLKEKVEEIAVPPPIKKQLANPLPKPNSADAGVIDYATPLYRINLPPKYPRSARHRGLEGTVLVEVFVNIAGKVKELKLLKSSGYTILDNAALKAVRKWSFSPGSVNGTLEAMRVRVPIRFRLNLK